MAATTKVKLKPCPFCGGKAVLLREYPEREKKGMYKVACDDGCCIQWWWSAIGKTAASDWNKRTVTAPEELTKGA